MQKKKKRDSFFLNIKKIDSYSFYPKNLKEEFPNNELKPAFYLIFWQNRSFSEERAGIGLQGCAGSLPANF